MPNRNAYIGSNVETLFKNSISEHPAILKTIQKHFNLQGRFLTAIKSGAQGDKADIRLSFAGGRFIDANVKAYRSGFNQLTRTTAKKFCEIFDLNKSDRRDLERILVTKAANTKLPLLDSNDLGRWTPFFKKYATEIVKWGFSSQASREIIVLYDRDTSRFRMYPMKSCLDNLDYTIEPTKGGFNIGSCISFQRKGGNGALSKNIPKIDIKHPGNHIQLKFQIRKFVDLMGEFKIGQYKV